LTACTAITQQQYSTQSACEGVTTAADNSVTACTYTAKLTNNGGNNFRVYSADRDAVTEDSLYTALGITGTGCTSTCTTLGTWKVDSVITTASIGSAVTQSSIYNTQFTNKKTWEQYPTNHAYALASKSQKRFYDEAHFYAECSGKGTCNRDSGECECYDGYSGSGCSTMACPNDCSGHGVCKRLKEQNSNYIAWDRQKTTTCVCDPGYTNNDCSGRVCASGDAFDRGPGASPPFSSSMMRGQTTAKKWWKCAHNTPSMWGTTAATDPCCWSISTAIRPKGSIQYFRVIPNWNWMFPKGSRREHA